MGKKNPALVTAPLVLWAILVWGVLRPWVQAQNVFQDAQLARWALYSGVVWWLVLMWAMHTATFQVAAMFSFRRQRRVRSAGDEPKTAILYTVCDDFDDAAFQSCLAQQASYYNCRVLVLDDSTDPAQRALVAKACSGTKAEYVRRSTLSGYKAGNLNDAIARADLEDVVWLLLVDADQRLPEHYLKSLMSRVPDDPRIGFVQAAQRQRAEEQNPFQAALSLDIACFYFRDLACRNTFGFVPLLGHGALVRRAAWEAVGGFPVLVSEDFAFAMASAAKGYRGYFVPDVTSDEEFPGGYAAFLIRLRKYAAGTGELFRKAVPSFLRSRCTLTEKWDFLMMLAWYVVMPAVVLNGFVSAYVVHRITAAGEPLLHPMLPFLYTWFAVCAVATCASVATKTTHALRYYVWAMGIYGASMPIAAASLFAGLVRPAVFRRTPKGKQETALELRLRVVMVFLGVAAIAAACWWRSVFSFFLLGQGAAYLGAALLWSRLHRATLVAGRRDLGGLIARLFVLVPGALMLLALFGMWWIAV